MCYMTYFNTASHFMAMSVATKINFLGLENFCMLYIASTLPLHTDRFDVQHDLLQHCFTLHGHVRDQQDQLLEVGELLHVVHCIFFASSYWSFWCATWPTSRLLHISWPCPWPPRSTSWGWRTFACCTLYLLCLFILIVLMCNMTYFKTTSHFMTMSVATKINFLRLENFCMLYIASTLPLHTDRFDVLRDLLQD